MTISWPEFHNQAWLPRVAKDQDRPEVGDTIAAAHAVWTVTAVVDVDLDDDDRDRWIAYGMPDPAMWRSRPYRAELEFVAGHRPPWAEPGDHPPIVAITVHARTTLKWWVYPTPVRWPQCSCCGEPMPCRAEILDKQVSAGVDEVSKHMSRQPGCCWHCGEQITHRQQAVVYDGDNLDLPGGIPVRIHLRNACRWILTYPKCPGILYVHADGSSTCVSWRDMLGQEVESAPDCQGHLTHDHGSRSACYGAEGGCPLGCSRKRHPGVSTSPRPLRRPQTTAALPGLTPGA